MQQAIVRKPFRHRGKRQYACNKWVTSRVLEVTESHLATIMEVSSSVPAQPTSSKGGGPGSLIKPMVRITLHTQGNGDSQ